MAALVVDFAVTLEAAREGRTTSLIDEAVTVADVDVDEATTQVVEVADGATDQAVSLGGLTTVQHLLLVSDREISVKLNADSAGKAVKTMLLQGTSLTALSVSNASGGLATVRVTLLGT